MLYGVLVVDHYLVLRWFSWVSGRVQLNFESSDPANIALSNTLKFSMEMNQNIPRCSVSKSTWDILTVHVFGAVCTAVFIWNASLSYQSKIWIQKCEFEVLGCFSDHYRPLTPGIFNIKVQCLCPPKHWLGIQWCQSCLCNTFHLSWSLLSMLNVVWGWWELAHHWCWVLLKFSSWGQWPLRWFTMALQRTFW